MGYVVYNRLQELGIRINPFDGAEQQGVRIIRTRKVYDIALAINTWHVLHLSARPFKLSRMIGKSLKKALNKRRG